MIKYVWNNFDYDTSKAFSKFLPTLSSSIKINNLKAKLSLAS